MKSYYQNLKLIKSKKVDKHSCIYVISKSKNIDTMMKTLKNIHGVIDVKKERVPKNNTWMGTYNPYQIKMTYNDNVKYRDEEDGYKWDVAGYIYNSVSGIKGQSSI